jgi:hypothetical protein
MGLDSLQTIYVYAQLAIELDDELRGRNAMTIKGVEYLGELMRRETERAQSRINQATETATTAFGKFHGAVDNVDNVVAHVEREAKEVEKLASDLTAQLGNSPSPAQALNGSGEQQADKGSTENPTQPQS